MGGAVGNVLFPTALGMHVIGPYLRITYNVDSSYTTAIVYQNSASIDKIGVRTIC